MTYGLEKANIQTIKPIKGFFPDYCRDDNAENRGNKKLMDIRHILEVESAGLAQK